MNLARWIKLSVGIICWLSSCYVMAVVNSIEQTGFVPASSMHANWAFSGVVKTEIGDEYAYFFQMQRHDNAFHAITGLFDMQNKKLIVQDEGDALINDPERFNWHVGNSFLRFNSITDSWVFGVKTPTKQGFNFKVDMLNQPEDNPVSQGLRSGIKAIVSQTSQLNGHIQSGGVDVDQFVTSRNTWFRQVWLTNTQHQSHNLNGVLCRFNDGSGFYSMNLVEPDAIRGSVAGWFDSDGSASAMSQFIKVDEAVNGDWHIHIASPKLDLILSDALKPGTMVAGFVSKKDNQGFCMLSRDDMSDIHSDKNV